MAALITPGQAGVEFPPVEQVVAWARYNYRRAQSFEDIVSFAVFITQEGEQYGDSNE